VERPLRLTFEITEERIAALEHEKAFKNLAASRKKGEAGRREAEEGQDVQEAVLQVLSDMVSEEVCTNRDAFNELLDEAFAGVGVMLRAPVRKAILNALSESSDDAEVCLDKDGDPESDPNLRDTENVPLLEDVGYYFEREVAPHVPDAWINEDVRDPKDGGVGRVGYEINFNRYFYVY
ncbi:MAG: SAM-dependent DNA methyltransferase, partial [Herbaspirillum sp.]|nr:SAM-dependent DNA methyltransferase [Herbaspirillum sp.]